VPQHGLQYHQPEQKTILLGWWGLGSITSALLALAFVPVAMFDVADGSWFDKLWYLSPMWAACCVAGVVMGIRGCQFQAKATKLQRSTAFAGTFLSLFVFVVLTVIVTVMSSS
jgi:hypothetical protein